MKKKILLLFILTIILSFFPLQASAEAACTHTWSDWEVYMEPVGNPVKKCGTVWTVMKRNTQIYLQQANMNGMTGIR